VQEKWDRGAREVLTIEGAALLHFDFDGSRLNGSDGVIPNPVSNSEL
jgi:hypothetical protein